MMDNNENINAVKTEEEICVKEPEYEVSSESATPDNNIKKPTYQKKPDDNAGTGIEEWLRKAFDSIVKWLKGCFMFLRDWLTGKRGSKGDRAAFAICLFLAIVVWLYAMSTTDTDYEKSFSGVLVNIEGASVLNGENMSVIKGYDIPVTVTLKGKRGDITSLVTDELNLYVDVSEIKETGKYALPVMVNLPKNATLVSVEPSQVSVEVDINTFKTVDVEAHLSYMLDSSYTLEDPTLNHRSVIVSGPKSVLDTIQYAAVTFNVGNIDRSMTLVGAVELYDSEGVVTNPYVKCAVSEIEVSIKVSTTKKVPVTIKIPTTLTSNYTITPTPAMLTVCGEPHTLNSISEICAYTFKEEEITEDSTKITVYTSNLDLPDGVRVVDYSKVDIFVKRK